MSRLSVARLSIWHWLLVGLLVLGIGFRFVNLDRKVYWLDETYTSLRVSGHTTAEAVQDLFDGRVLSLADLQKYQRLDPATHWTDTVRSLAADSPQHPPLYFLLVRQWAQWFGDSVTAIRSLSAICSLLVFPALYWLCWEVFGTARSGWLGITLIAVSPFHLLYAQEARQYSLWTVLILVSTTALLRSLRSNTQQNWAFYAINLILLLYSFLFSVFVLLGHGIYVWGCQGWKLSKTTLAFLIASGMSLLGFLPWLLLILTSQPQIQESTVWINRQVTFSFLIHRWIIHVSNLFFDLNLGYKNLTVPSLVVFGFVVYAVWFSCRNAQRSIWLLILSLIIPVCLALILPDLVLGGRRSTIARYLIPAYLGVQLAVIYWLDCQLSRAAKPRDRWIGGGVWLSLLLAGILSCGISLQAKFWWHKSPSTHQPYEEMAKLIHRMDQPLVISDDSQEINNSFANRLFTFSYFLEPQVKFQLVRSPKIPQIPHRYNHVFVFSPAKHLIDSLVKQQNYSAKIAFQAEPFWLWQLTQRQPTRVD